MVKQTINTGTSEGSGDGESIRSAFTKVNSNFDELYAGSGGSGSVDRSWADPWQTTFNAVEWNSGNVINIEVTPTETDTLTTYDASLEGQSMTDSTRIYFAWDADFYNDVWEGYQHPIGEGVAFEISQDNGVTWRAVERNGSSSDTYLFFEVPYDLQGQYTFTYTPGQSVLIRYNRGSLPTVWFDLANGPVDPTTVVSVEMSLLVLAAPVIADVTESAIIHYDSVRFANTAYSNNTSAGRVEYSQYVYSGSSPAIDALDMFNRYTNEQADNGRIYASFDTGSTGTITAYWNAKLFTITPAEEG